MKLWTARRGNRRVHILCNRERVLGIRRQQERSSGTAMSTISPEIRAGRRRHWNLKEKWEKGEGEVEGERENRLFL